MASLKIVSNALTKQLYHLRAFQSAPHSIWVDCQQLGTTVVQYCPQRALLLVMLLIIDACVLFANTYGPSTLWCNTVTQRAQSSRSGSTPPSQTMQTHQTRCTQRRTSHTHSDEERTTGAAKYSEAHKQYEAAASTRTVCSKPCQHCELSTVQKDTDRHPAPSHPPSHTHARLRMHSRFTDTQETITCSLLLKPHTCETYAHGQTCRPQWPSAVKPKASPDSGLRPTKEAPPAIMLKRLTSPVQS